MKNFFRSLTTEWGPNSNINQAKHALTDYIIRYYSQTRTHQHTGKINPNRAKKLY